MAAALAACSDSGPPSVARSFDVIATLSFPSHVDQYGLPASERLVLRLDDTSTGVDALWGADVGEATSLFERTGATLSLRAPVTLAVAPEAPDSTEAFISFEILDLALIDSDDDGKADAVEGTGTGEFSHVVGRVEINQAFTVELRGEPDTTWPELTFDSGPVDLHVFDQVRIVASEPLHPDTKIVLRYGDDGRIELDPSPSNGKYVRSFVTPSLLPFGAELSIEVDPASQDLAGNRLIDESVVGATMPDPGLFAANGFEGDPAAVVGDVEVVDGVGVLPALAGARSLLIEPRETATMRVPLTGSETYLRFEARALLEVEYADHCARIGIRAGFPGLPHEGNIADVAITPPMDPLEFTDDLDWSYAAPVTTVELELPEETAGEVIVDVYELQNLPDPYCRDFALLIDDLRVE